MAGPAAMRQLIRGLEHDKRVLMDENKALKKKVAELEGVIAEMTLEQAQKDETKVIDGEAYCEQAAVDGACVQSDPTLDLP